LATKDTEESTVDTTTEHGTDRVKRGLAEMLKGGVIMDVVNADQAKIAEEAGAVAVMALERVPADIRALGGVARMADPAKVTEIINAVSIPVIMCFMLSESISPTLSWLWQVPLILLIQTVMAIGLALTVATCNVFFRDLERLTTIAMHLLFYATPILYPVQKLADVPRGYRFALLWLNPFTPLIQCWHGVFYDGVVEPQYIVGAAVWAALSLCVGVPVYRAMVWRFAEIV
jgi:hypothetical protein